MISTIEDWANLLRRISDHAGASDPSRSLEDFADEAGHRRAVDRPFLAWLGRREPPAQAAPPSTDPDVAIWHAIATDTPIPEAVWEFHRRSEWRSDFDAGSLFPQRNASGPIAIEVWTEVELSALQGLAWKADADPDLRSLVRQTAHWLTENLQPDNATNHPWAIHVFAAIGVRDNNPDASMYAQTLLHNCQVAQGRSDAFSALILKDAADALENGSIGSWLPQSH
jgi:hypothetical protein